MNTPEQPIRLHALTFQQPPPEPEADPCTGSYLCPCNNCDTERTERRRRGVRPRARQPWDIDEAA